MNLRQFIKYSIQGSDSIDTSLVKIKKQCSEQWAIQRHSSAYSQIQIKLGTLFCHLSLTIVTGSWNTEMSNNSLSTELWYRLVPGFSVHRGRLIAVITRKKSRFLRIVGDLRTTPTSIGERIGKINNIILNRKY